MSIRIRRRSPVNLVTTEPEHCSIELRQKILRRLPFFSGLDEAAIDSLNDHFVELSFQPGDTIYLAGDPAERLFVVAEGSVKLLQHAPEGRDVLLDLLTSGEFFGSLTALGVERYPDTAEANSAGCALSIRSAAFRQILDERPGLALRALEVVGRKLSEANLRVMQLSSQDVETRVAYTLLKLAHKLGKPKEDFLLIDTPLTRTDLAEMTAATPETVSRVLSQMQAEGTITSGRQWVGIRNLDQLARLAGDN